METTGKSMQIFGYPLKDWVILCSILGLGGGGYTLFGGTPAQVQETVISRTDTLFQYIQNMDRTIDRNTNAIFANTYRVGDLEYQRRQDRQEMDDMRDQMTKGFAGIDGYFQPADTSKSE